MSNQELAERIKAARKSVGLHMTELAERIGVSSNYISLLERAERNPSDAVLNKIAVHPGKRSNVPDRGDFLFFPGSPRIFCIWPDTLRC